ncbi:2-hydroxyacid dehydrogenase [Mesobacterium pallidum]|uniref:2-hydroxyacid dehydrogenase n=1 Tax=Mesobacterium pallidum TaxID=2872037 RepID=UPI001EE28A75|nr:glyoxylate/hydroxypyruvate reductase A [Mesobacterium pallidum]
MSIDPADPRPLRVLFAGQSERWEEYETPLSAAFARHGLEVELDTEFPPETVDYIITAPNGTVQDFTPYTKAKAVLNLWAGVEGIIGNETLTQPLCRMIETGLTQGMVEWVTGHVLRHHLGLDRDITRDQPVWDFRVPPLATDRKVTILGMGELGQACALALAGLGFDVAGWSRSEKRVPGVECLSGEAGLTAAMNRAEILVLLLPLTPATRHLIDVATLARLPKGAVILNPGRGLLIDDDALLAALDAGHIAHATLDVFAVEPLPEGHPYWAHPSVTVTPHIASSTRPGTSSESIAENIRRCEAGEPLIGLVDRGRGY